SGWCAMCQLFFCLHTLVRRRPGGLGGIDDVNRYVMPSPLLTISSAEEFRARWFSTTIYDSLYDWTMRLILASVYALALFGNLSAITPIIAKAKHQPFFSTVLNMAAVGSSALFVALAAATILTRLPPIRKSEGIAPRIAASLGTYLAFVLAMLPRPDLPPIILTISLV